MAGNTSESRTLLEEVVSRGGKAMNLVGERALDRD